MPPGGPCIGETLSKTVTRIGDYIVLERLVVRDLFNSLLQKVDNVAYTKTNREADLQAEISTGVFASQLFNASYATAPMYEHCLDEGYLPDLYLSRRRSTRVKDD